MNPSDVVIQIAPPIDTVLAESLIQEFINIERRYVLGDWEPATLDGGQFAEIAGRIVYHIDTANLNRRKGLDACLDYIEEEKNVHYFPHRRTALHICKVLRTLYKFRSQRGAVHIDPDYSANELDATFVLAMVRWLMAEFLRVFWTGSTSDVAQAVKEIVRYEVPAVLVVDNRPLVLRTDCTVEEEILLLLHNAGENGLSRSALGQAIPKSPTAISLGLQKLCGSNMRQVVKRANATYILTPNGTKRIHEDLSNKLRIG